MFRKRVCTSVYKKRSLKLEAGHHRSASVGPTLNASWEACFFIRESLPQFENRIMARCMQGALRVVLCTKKLHFVSRNWLWKISSVACGFSSIKIDFSDCPKSLISRINEVYGGFFQ